MREAYDSGRSESNHLPTDSPKVVRAGAVISSATSTKYYYYSTCLQRSLHHGAGILESRGICDHKPYRCFGLLEFSVDTLTCYSIIHGRIVVQLIFSNATESNLPYILYCIYTIKLLLYLTIPHILTGYIGRRLLPRAQD